MVVDLDPDPNSWVHLSATQMAERLYARADSGVERLPVKAVHLNRAPMLAPLGVLNGVDTERIALDPERCLRHAAVICAMPDLSLRVAEALRLADSELPAGAAPLDADRALYDGFIEGADRAVCQRVLKADPTRLRREDFRFADPRLHALLWRRQARWYPDSLSAAEQQQWRLEVQQRLSGQDGYRSLDAFDAQLAALRQSRLEQLPALQRLLQWRQARFGDMPPMQAHG